MSQTMTFLMSLHYYLEIAVDVSHEKQKQIMAGVYEPSPGSVRKVCLLWAAYMAHRETNPSMADFEITPSKPSMDMLRRALDQVRNHDGQVDLNAMKVFCATAGDVIDFSSGCISQDAAPVMLSAEERANVVEALRTKATTARAKASVSNEDAHPQVSFLASQLTKQAEDQEALADRIEG